ncbi:hypothetical protein SLS60_008692 [Paraconiothyrium brasiliense]|uniref:Uncharacterized protein n=1 Tax=Paraconiothyrium brasiliense TaxID=300254 RepID=A0ABR3QY68_9PLEO
MPSKPTLEIHPTPFKPSHLSIPPSPFSPRTPLPLSTLPQTHYSRPLPAPDSRYVPPSPLKWLWQCHQCRRTYSLGVTRRCLEDGHAFCAGTTSVKTWRRPLRAVRKKHRACASEFDYAGWKTWGRWKRSGRKDSIYDEDSSSSSDEDMSSDESTTTKSSVQQKDCWNTCDYPSECRWGRRFGVHTPVEVATLPAIETFQATPTPTPTTCEGILKAENCKEVKGKKGDKTDFWGALVASATRRKSVPPSSPLASGADASGDNHEEVTVKDRDGDVVMGSIGSELAPITTSSTVVTLKELLRKAQNAPDHHVKLQCRTKRAA